MAANAETTNGKNEPLNPKGFRKVWAGTVEQIQGRLKDVEKVWTDTVEQINTFPPTKEVLELAKKVETDSKKHFDALKEQLKFDELLGKLKSTGLAGQGAKLGENLLELGEDTLDKLGLAQKADLDAVSAKLDGLKKELGALKKKRTTGVTKKDFNALVKRVDKLEKAKK